MSDSQLSDTGTAVVVERGVLRATFPAPIGQERLESALAAAWVAVVAEHGGQVDVLRVAHALDSRWHDPLGRPLNRARTGEQPAWGDPGWGGAPA